MSIILTDSAEFGSAQSLNPAQLSKIALKKEQEDNASLRYKDRTSTRDQNLATIKDKGPEGIEEVEGSERVQTRLRLINENDGLGLERLIDVNDLLDINYLTIGTKKSKSVCHLQVRDITGRFIGHGTGFMVSPSLLITNHHVFTAPEDCRRSLAEFNLEDDDNFLPKPTKLFILDPARFFYTSKDLDFTLVAVSPNSADNTSLANYGFLELFEKTGKAWLTEAVSSVQHPGGAFKQIALRNNKIVDIFDNFLQYTTDTLPGSSGSPVFNDQWMVVALHHSGVKHLDEQGRVLAKGGGLWEPSMGQDAIDWIANEGIRVSAIMKDLRAKPDWTPAQKGLIDEIVSISDQVEAVAETTGVNATTVPVTPIAPASAPVVVAPDAVPNDQPALPEMEVGELNPEVYTEAAGYDPNFLSQKINLPQLSAANQMDIALLTDGSDLLKYTHFSLMMSQSRRLAFYTAVNIDGNKKQEIIRTKDVWYFDPRLDKKYQLGPELYKNNQLDRGHLVRRQDPDWDTMLVAQQANQDTFHFTNCSPQYNKLNQGIWNNLEDYILNNATKFGLKVNVFTGPVFRVDDRVYRGVKIPAEFWKVVVIVKDDGHVSATAYLQSQKNMLEDLEFAYGVYQTYQVAVSTIETLTQLDFGDLRDHDPLKSDRTPEFELAAVEPTVLSINTYKDIRL